MLYRLSEKGDMKGSLIDRSFRLPLTIGSSWRRTNNICRQLSLFRLVPLFNPGRSGSLAW